MANKIKKGNKFGDWQLKKQLGQGGNAVVWLASNSASELAAIKFLTKRNDKKWITETYPRFISEIEVIQQNNDIDGLLPIIEYYLPDQETDDIPWYVMPVAEQSVDKYVVEYNFEKAIQIVLEVGKTLIKLHERDISHRDIKPANILVLDEKYYLSDLGLVDYPDKKDLTRKGERIGARWTIAPEMERDSKNAEGKPADVYSLAKTLWILLTGKKFGFEGQYNPENINGLSNLRLTELEKDGFLFTKAPLLYIKPLDDLLQDSTNDVPSQRPNISQFCSRLELWIQIYQDFKKRNPLQWQDVQAKLFPTALPQRVIWEDPNAIIEILKFLSSIDYLNHMHLPDGGGWDLLDTCKGSEPSTLELKVGDKAIYIVKPKRLVFESFGFDLEWNYFRLETGDLEPTGLTTLYNSCEALMELSPQHYISRDDWEDGRNQDIDYSGDFRFVKRCMHGDFLIIQKTSLYNRSAYTYSGIHNQLGVDEFRAYVFDKVQVVQQIHNDKHLLEKAIENGWEIDDFIFSCLEQVFRQEYLAKKESTFL